LFCLRVFIGCVGCGVGSASVGNFMIFCWRVGLSVSQEVDLFSVDVFCCCLVPCGVGYG